MRRAWAYLNTPSNFRNDWYGELTNQEGHTLLGIRLAVMSCTGWASMFGGMPYKVLVIGLIGLGYLAVEIRQGWASGDSWFDAAMVFTGALGVLVPITEIDVPERWYAANVEINFLWLAGIWIARDLALFARVYKRMPHDAK